MLWSKHYLNAIIVLLRMNILVIIKTIFVRWLKLDHNNHYNEVEKTLVKMVKNWQKVRLYIVNKKKTT